MAASALQIFLLDGFRVVAGGRVVEHGAWRLRKAQSLVKLLALAPSFRLHREQVLETLWPELDPHSATNNLHQVVHAARRALEPALERQQPSRYLTLHNDLLSLAAPGGVWVDARAFEALADQRRTGSDAALEDALQLYVGDLLPDEPYEDWAIANRDRLRERFMAVLVALAERREARGDFSGAVQAYERITAADPAREPAQAALIRLYAAMGDRRRALHQYTLLRRALREELAVEPGPATHALDERIRKGELESPPPAESAAEPARLPALAAPASAALASGPPLGNLPIPLSSFIGREAEAAHVRTLLEAHRLVTVTGLGGAGKSRLVAYVAASVQRRFRDGVWLVDVDTLVEPAQLLPRVAEALHLRLADEEGPALGAVVDQLRSSHALLVLDGCEHLTAACAAFCWNVLSACPDVYIAVTSRQPLGVPGEVAWTVPPLSVPEDPALLDEEWAEYDAVRLFVERARVQRPGFALSPENAATVAEICRRLDGLPLAIELAAARIRVLSPQQIAARLAHRFELLTSGGGAAPARQQTLLAAMAWSYGLLSERERVLFRRLSVLDGPWLLEDAERVCAGDGLAAADVMDLLSGLLDKSLLVVEGGPEAPPAFRMLETVREFAWQQLVESGEAEALLDRMRHR